MVQVAANKKKNIVAAVKKIIQTDLHISMLYSKILDFGIDLDGINGEIFGESFENIIQSLSKKRINCYDEMIWDIEKSLMQLDEFTEEIEVGIDVTIDNLKGSIVELLELDLYKYLCILESEEIGIPLNIYKDERIINVYNIIETLTEVSEESIRTCVNYDNRKETIEKVIYHIFQEEIEYDA